MCWEIWWNVGQQMFQHIRFGPDFFLKKIKNKNTGDLNMFVLKFETTCGNAKPVVAPPLKRNSRAHYAPHSQVARSHIKFCRCQDDSACKLRLLSA